MSSSGKDKKAGVEGLARSVLDLKERLQYELSSEGIRDKYEKEAERIIRQNPDLMKNPDLEQNIEHLLELMGYDKTMLTLLRRNLDYDYKGGRYGLSSPGHDFFEKNNLPCRYHLDDKYYLSEQELKNIIRAILNSTDEYLRYQDQKDMVERENESTSCVFFDSGNQIGYEIVSRESCENSIQRVRRTARIKREENGEYTISEERTIIPQGILENYLTLASVKELPLSKTEARFNNVGLNTSVMYSEVKYDSDCHETGGYDYKIVRDSNNPFVAEAEWNERGSVHTSYKRKAKRLVQPSYLGTDQLMSFNFLLSKGYSSDMDTSMFGDNDMTINDDDQVSVFLRQNFGLIKNYLDPSKYCGIVYGNEELTRQYLLACHDKLITNICAEVALSNALFSGTAMSDAKEARNSSSKLPNVEKSGGITQ